MLLDSSDSLWPGAYALIGDSCSILSFRFGESDEGVLQFLFECRARPCAKVITQEGLNDGTVAESSGGAEPGPLVPYICSIF